MITNEEFRARVRALGRQKDVAAWMGLTEANLSKQCKGLVEISRRTELALIALERVPEERRVPEKVAAAAPGEG